VEQVIDTDLTWNLKLLKQVRFESFGQDIICPIGRCLEIIEFDDHGWWIEVDEGAGSFYFRKDDKRVVQATLNDLLTEPEYNDYETTR